MKTCRRVLWFALPAAFAAAALLCLPGGASARGLDDEALTVSVSGAGTVTGTGINCRASFSGDCVETYAPGTVVTLTETPDSGATFTGWDGLGGCTGTATTCTLTMTDSFAITAGFTAGGGGGGTQTLTVTASGNGTVTGTGINCGNGASDCSESYATGTAVTLTETPASGATFSGWGGACSGTATTCPVTMSSAKNVTATFTGGVASATLTVTATGNGKVTGTGIDCGNGATDCTEAYAVGTAVTLTETPASGATFSGWGGACSGTATTCLVTMTASKSVTATFSGGAASATLTVSVSGNGKVLGPGINCGSGSTDCTESFTVGSSVTIVEVAGAGATFVGWGNACTGTGVTCAVSMMTSRTVTASFSTTTTTQATLGVIVTGSGHVTGPGINCGLGNTDCSEIYTTGTAVTLVATPASGASFAGWGGNCSGTMTTCTLTMTASKSATASFSQGSTQKILTVTVGGSGRVSGTGISCGISTHDCSNAYNDGAAVTLTATPAAGAVFLGWGGACSGTAKTCYLVMDSPKAVSASFSTPGSSPSGSLFARSLGSPIVLRTSVGWSVSLRFFTSKSASALLRLSLNGRLVNAFTFSPHSGDVIVGPFNVARPGTYKFRLTLSDGRGATAEVLWNLCLSINGCGSYRPATFVRSLGVTATRTASGWLVNVRFQSSGNGAASIRLLRGGRIVSSGSFTFHSGAVVVHLPAYRSGVHQIVLTVRNAAGRTYQLTWTVLLS